MRVDPKTLVRRLTPSATRLLESAVGAAANAQHYEILVEHMLIPMLSIDDGEAARLLAHAGIDRRALLVRIERMLSHMRSGNAGRPTFSESLFQWFEDAWLLASLDYNESKIRSGVLLMQFIRRADRYCGEEVPEFEGIEKDKLKKELVDVLATTSEAVEAASPSGGGAAGGPARAGAPSSESALGRFTTNFTEDARQGRIDPIFGRHREIRQMIDILSRRRKNNPIIVGEPGVGKTALVEGLALSIVEGDVPDHMKNMELIGLDLGALQAGASVKGEFENRLKAVISEIKASPKPVILFIDEAHMLIGAGGAQGGGDAANLLKPALARGELRTVAATTWAEYKKYFEKDAALERRFQPVKVDEPSEHDAIVMMRGIAPIYEKSHGVRIRDEAIVAAVQLSSRYISGRQLPDKSVDLLDMTAARVRVARRTKPEDLVELEQKAMGLEREITSVQRDLDEGKKELAEPLEKLRHKLTETHEAAAKLREKWGADTEAAEKLIALRAEQPNSPEAQADLASDSLISIDVDAEAVARTVASWTGIPIGKMKADNVKAVLALDKTLKERVIGQDHAIEAVSEAVRMSQAGIRDPNAPIAVFLFCGTSGVGKTETALALADLLYGGERFMTTINMTEFQEKHSVSRLIGSPPGYVGYGEGGLLTEAVRQRPYSVVLLDECEKADPEVLNLFYQVFDKGMLSDSEGRQIDFKNTIIILTSNLATDTIMEMNRRDEIPTNEAVLEAIRPALNKHFKPALVARMNVIPFRPMDPASMQQITKLKLRKLVKRIEVSHNASVTVSQEVIEEIARRCTEADTGARNVDHILRGSLMPAIARELLERMAREEKTKKVDIGLSPTGNWRIDFE